MSRFTQLFSFVALVALSSSSLLLAQDGAMTELYGEGVHRYNCGDYQGADQMLSQVVDSGSQDPRALYFRGLAREMLAHGSGEADFQVAARMEAEGKRVVNVGQALARVQGRQRASIEQYRREARVAFQLEQAHQAEIRRKTIPQPTEVAPVDPAEAASSDPFSGDGMRSEEAVELPTTDAPAPSEPSALDAPAAPAADTSNPFGDEPASSEPAAPAPADNPFGDVPADAGDSPFGPATTETPAIEAPAAEPNPFGTDPAPAPAAADDNPFGF